VKVLLAVAAFLVFRGVATIISSFVFFILDFFVSPNLSIWWLELWDTATWDS
jgi:hypothetical protein